MPEHGRQVKAFFRPNTAQTGESYRKNIEKIYFPYLPEKVLLLLHLVATMSHPYFCGERARRECQTRRRRRRSGEKAYRRYE
jgi:hypothetical protein